MVIRGTSAYL